MCVSQTDAYEEAGNIQQDAIEHGEQLITAGSTHLEVARDIEQLIRERGGEPAFPVNLSIDNQAAHRTPAPDEETVFRSQDVVCLDIGVHVDGFVADGATTVDLSGQHTALIESAEDALSTALDAVESGVDVRDIGALIEQTIESHGFTTVENLAGHGVGQFEAHTDPRVPNVSGQSSETLTTGDVIAVEPFASYAHDTVKRLGEGTQIYEFAETKQLRGTRARQTQQTITQQYTDFPFAFRWISADATTRGIQQLVKHGGVESHPVIGVSAGDVVVQAEHTVLVEDNGCTRLT